MAFVLWFAGQKSEPALWPTNPPDPHLAYSFSGGEVWAVSRDAELSKLMGGRLEDIGGEWPHLLGGTIHSVAGELNERGLVLPEAYARLATPTAPAASLGGGKPTLITVNGEFVFASSWLFGPIEVVITIVDGFLISAIRPVSPLPIELTMRESALRD